MFCKSIEHGTAFIVHLENWESYEYEESIHSFEEILYTVIKSEPLFQRLCFLLLWLDCKVANSSLTHLS